MKSGIIKRIETLESQMESTESDHWDHCIVLCGGGSFQYVRNTSTGQRVYDAGFIAQITNRHKGRSSNGVMRFTPIHVQIGPDDESSDAIREAIERGIVPANVQRAANFNEPDDAPLAAEIIAMDRNSIQ